MYAGFKDPATFTHKMAFGTVGRPNLITHLEWKAGRILSWTPAQYDDHELWVVIAAALDTWRQCADGTVEGKTALRAGALTLTKGPVAAAIEMHTPSITSC